MTDLDELIEAAREAVNSYPVASGLVERMDCPDGYGPLKRLRLALEVLASRPDTAYEAGKREGLEEAARACDAFEHEENGRAYDKRQAGRDDNFNCARASAARMLATSIRDR